MGTMKDAADTTATAIKGALAVRAWASGSSVRTLFVTLLVAALLIVGQCVYLNYLLTEAKKSGESQRREVTALTKELGYKVAMDAITLCLESVKDKPALHTWYCEQAVFQYRNVSTGWPNERVNEVIDRFAFAAMKNDVSHYLRSLELDRLAHSPATKEEEVLKLLLSKAVIALWIIAVLAVTGGAYLFLRILPNRRKGAHHRPPN